MRPGGCRPARAWGAGLRRSLPHAAFVAAVALVAAACSTSPAKSSDGLELVISADGLSAPADFDDVRLEISEQSSGTWTRLWDRDYVVPSAEATLPTTFTVLAGQSADEAIIVVTAYKGGASGQPVVQRVAQVQVPTDRLAVLYLVLAKICEGQVTVTGAEGEPMSTCGSGQSCQPSTGECGSNVVDPSTLPTYAPGQSLDAGAIGEGATAPDAGEPDAPGADAGPDATAPESSTDSGPDATVDSGPDGPSGSDASDAGHDACAPTGTGAVALIGCPCPTIGALACNGNAQKLALVCSGANWTLLTACQPGFNCNTTPGANQGLCEAIDPLCAAAMPGGAVCSSTTQTLQCGADLLSDQDSPGPACSGQTCVSGRCSGACSPGATRCSGQQPQQCDPSGTWQNTGATCPYACSSASSGDAGSGSAACTGVCTPGALQCNGQQPQACDATGTWQSSGALCPGVCTAGMCATSCSHGATQCENSGVLTCSASGQWGGFVGCPFLCSSGACAGVCTPGATQCSAGGLRTCDATGSWGTAAACSASTPACVNGACAACMPGATLCAANGVETCSPSGVWSTAAACANQTCVSGACTGVCAPGQAQCSDSADYQSCTASGQWSSPAPCNDQACLSGSCTGLCTPGATQCNGLQPQACGANGSWQSTGATCPYVCTGGICTGSCTPGATQCNGQQPELCDSTGTWQSSGTPCANACSNGMCTGSCTSGATQCSGNGVETCGSSGQWGSAMSCTYVCSSGACSGVCSPGSTQCSDSADVETCDGTGNWGSPSPCTGSAPVCLSGACVACTPGATQCSGTSVATCTFLGQWGAPVPCTNQACVSGACAGVCAPGSTQCSTTADGGPGDGVEGCNSSGQWGSPAACNNQGCVNGACTGVCAPGAVQCSGQQPQTCDYTGTWQNSGASCPYVCTSGACTGSCTPGATQCAGQQPQTCDAAGNWTNTGQPCAYVCSSGACAGSCTPMSTQCSGNGVETCSSGGTWGNPSACTYVCVSGSCTGVCTPGATQCSGTGTETCNSNGQWGSPTACTTSVANATPTCSGGTCAFACNAGYSGCSGSCVDETSDPNNCGGCGNVCTTSLSNASPTCTSGTCGFACNAGYTTGLSGNVYDPGNTLPVYGALVYVPSGAVQTPPTGVASGSCGTVSAPPTVVSATTAVDGSFTLANPPTGSAVTVVVQLGKWQRVFSEPVTACQTTAVGHLTLPSSHTQGNIPLIAIDTGAVDAMECEFLKMGIVPSEFVDGPPGASAGRIQFYKGNKGGTYGGVTIDGATPPDNQLTGNPGAMNAYDAILFPCGGSQVAQPGAALNNLVNYASSGGRVYATHFSYTWIYTNGPFSSTANWTPSNGSWPGPFTGNIDQSFARGMTLAQWLQVVGASTVVGQIPVQVIRNDFASVVPPSQRWIYTMDPPDQGPSPMPIHYSFNTPVGAPPASQCGKVVFSDFHVENPSGSTTNGLTFPSECNAGPMTPQEKLLEFLILDLTGSAL